MTNTPKIIGMGNALVDIIIQLPSDDILDTLALPKGSMQLVEQNTSKAVLDYFKDTPYHITTGGSASNTIHGISHLGIETAFIGVIGEDSFGETFESTMLTSGIKPMLLRGKNPTGKAITLMSQDSERTFATYLGAAIELSAKLLDNNLFKGYHFFYIEGYLVQNYELIRRSIELAKEEGLKVVLDLASYNVVEENLAFLKEIITKYVDIIFANEEEARAFTGKDPQEALLELSKICDIAIVKVGKNGSYAQKGDQVVHTKAWSNICVDTNGAGDGYAAGFMYGICHNKDLQTCCDIGSLVAGNIVTVIGPKLDDASWVAIKKQL